MEHFALTVNGFSIFLEISENQFRKTSLSSDERSVCWNSFITCSTEFLPKMPTLTGELILNNLLVLERKRHN